MSKPEYMSQEAYNQRVKAGFKKNPNFSGEWTMVRIRKDVRDKLIQTNRLRVMPAWRSSSKSKKTLDLFCLVAEKEGEQQND